MILDDGLSIFATMGKQFTASVNFIGVASAGAEALGSFALGEGD